MADYIATTEELTAVADAIRAKGGTSEQLVFPEGFVSAIGDIQTGGSGQGITAAGIANLDNWVFVGGTNQDATLVNEYAPATGVNSISYTGTGGSERLIYMARVKSGKTYEFGFTLSKSDPFTYWNSSKQYDYAFVARSFLFSASPDVDSLYSQTGGIAKTPLYQSEAGTQDLTARFTASYNYVFLYIDFAMLSDGSVFQFEISDIRLTEI